MELILLILGLFLVAGFIGKNIYEYQNQESEDYKERAAKFRQAFDAYENKYREATHQTDTNLNQQGETI